MDGQESLRTVGRAVQNAAAVEFVQQVVRAGYHENFTTDFQAADRLVDEAFAELVRSQDFQLDPARLAETSRWLTRDLFHRGERSFWFNAHYHQYKTVEKPEEDFRQLRDLIPGMRVLDYGCGSGYLAARLARGGYKVFTTDVLDYRYEEARHLPFVKMTFPTEIEYPADSIDTALVQAVLHHIDPPDLPGALEGLRRVATHLLIKEDTYDLPAAMEGLGRAVAEQPLLATFVRLPVETQFQALVLIDYYANAVAQGISDMNLPFSFKSPAEWEHALSDNGWRVMRMVLGGFEPGRMHKSCHIWMLCERGEP